MISIYARGAFALASLLLAACEMMPPLASGTRMDGQWASTDGIFTATFNDGNFTSVDARTGAVLAQGTYSVAGDQVSMQWLSLTARQQRAANCTFAGATSLRCVQTGGGNFELRRTA
jgi:hypothetical protein